MANYAAEIEVWPDKKVEREKITNYDEVQGATKAVKGVIKKRAKKFQLVDGVLPYTRTL